MKKTISIVIISVFLIFISIWTISSLNSNKEKYRVSSGYINQKDASKSENTQDMSAIPPNLNVVIVDVIERQNEENVVIMDVRTDQEWDTEHVTGALQWGLAEHLSKGEMPNIDKDTEIFVYCRSGNRAGQAIKIMEKNGFTNMTNIRGIEDWKEAGGEVER